MLDPTTLFHFASHVDQRRIHVRTLVVALGGFVDAGHAQALLGEHLRNTLSSRRLGEFDADELIDYRENRPRVVFDRDHYADVRGHELTLDLVEDAAGEPFLLLTGPEPALQWERMAAAIKHLISQLDVEFVMTAQSIPLPTPHTRPVMVTKHASDPSLLPGNQPVFGQILMSAAFSSFLEVRLAEAGIPTVGLTAHVPQYLADNDFPDAVIALVQGIRDHAGLRIPTEALAVAAGIVRAQVGAQIQQSEELSGMLGAMEQQYDQAVERLEITRRAEAELPDADEIGEEAEAFLRDLGSDDETATDAAPGRPDPDGDAGPSAGQDPQQPEA